MFGIAIEELIDRESIAKASTDIEAARKRHADANAALETCHNAVKSAGRAADAAVTAGGDGVAEERAIAEAQIAERAAQRVADATRRAIASAETAHTQATAEAHKKVFWAGVRGRIEASRAAEAAKLALEKAQRDHADATLLLGTARSAGCTTSGVIHAANQFILPVQDELKIWANDGLDIENQLFRGGVK